MTATETNQLLKAGLTEEDIELLEVIRNGM